MYNPHLPCIARYVRYDSREARDLASNLITNPFHLLYTGVQAVICPECKAPMMVVEYDEIELDHCVQCEGTWFDRGELMLLFQGIDRDEHGLRPEQIAALPAAETDEVPRRCPVCRRKMRKLLVGPRKNVLIDACPEGDGLWFDSGETVALAQQVADAVAGADREVLRFMGRVFRKREAPGDEEGESA